MFKYNFGLLNTPPWEPNHIALNLNVQIRISTMTYSTCKSMRITLMFNMMRTEMDWKLTDDANMFLCNILWKSFANIDQDVFPSRSVKIPYPSSAVSWSAEKPGINNENNIIPLILMPLPLQKYNRVGRIFHTSTINTGNK